MYKKTPKIIVIQPMTWKFLSLSIKFNLTSKYPTIIIGIAETIILRNKDLKSAIEDRKNMSFTESTIIATHENNFKILRKGKVKLSEIRKVIKDEN